MKKVTIHEAKTHLSRLLVAVSEGDELVVCKGDQPVARLVPYRRTRRSRPKVGEITSQPVAYTEDCFAPLSEDELMAWGV